ncbi:MAG: response regulator [Lachnospiraceae bacterium]|nr:response regulator [Lachnospiraceae bacterium]
MRYIVSLWIYSDFILALYFAISLLIKSKCKYTENCMFLVFCLSSALWSFGFFGVFIQTEPDNAYIWRAIGMVGTFAYLISAQALLCFICNMPKKFSYITQSISSLGIILYFFVIQKNQVTYEPTKYGMSYTFKPGLLNNLYTIYTIILAINMLIVVIYTLKKSKTQRLIVLAKKLLIAEGIIALGMVFDTIFPLMGLKAFPGSTLAQFIGLTVIYHSISFVNHSRINISNMSEFIYYSLKVPVLVYDASLNLQILNDSAYSFLGVKDGPLNYTGIDELFEAEHEDIFTFTEQSHDVDAICCNNNLYCSLSVNKIYDAYKDVIGYIIIVTDLSERMKSMRKLEEAKQEAESANKAKSTFLANMSHEIRTPMNAIVGFSELVLKMDIDENARKHVEDIKWSSHNLLAIINDILDFSKIESGKMELVTDTYYTSHMLNDITLIITPQAEKKGLTFNIDIDTDIPRTLFGDKVRLRSVLTNILNNAVKYTKQGSVTFKASVIKRYEDNVTLEFKISDTGIGIKEQNIPNLFKDFERLDERVHYGIEGSGLGLAIANNYINLMDGNINVESEYGKGSTFTITLEQKIIDPTPIEYEYTRESSSHNTGNISDIKISGISVLVVDDNIVNLRVAEEILRFYGLHVDTASNGTVAIELCHSRNYSLVFMDQMMPDVDGIQAMEEIRCINSHYATGGDCKIIVLTADAIKGTREALLRKGFDEYLGKPINIHQLERLFMKYIPKENINHEEVDRRAEKLDSSEIAYLKDSLPLVNVENGIYNCGGKIEDYLKILKITHDYGERQLIELENAWSKKDYNFYVIKIHALKSTLLNIGATELSEQARQQELQGKAHEYSYIDDTIKDFQSNYRKLVEDINVVLSHYKMLDNPPNDTEAEAILDSKISLQIIKNIEHYINNFDFEKVFNILEESKKFTFSEKHRSLLNRIEELMDDLSVDEILELIHSEIREV